MTTETADGVAVERACPRCGAASAGAPWCPACGLNLRVRGAAHTESIPPAPTPASAPPRRGPSTAVLLAIVAVVAIVGAVVAVVVLTRGSGTKAAVTAPVTVARTGPGVTPAKNSITTAAPAASDVVTVADMHGVLDEYAGAYSSEDIVLLGNLLAPGLIRQNGSDPPEGRAQALATYQQQFDALTSPSYRLTNLTYETGAGEGVAFGAYVIDHAGGTARGTIFFHFVSRGSRLLIDRIQIKPA